LAAFKDFFQLSLLKKVTQGKCKTPQMYAGYLGRIGQDVLPKREGLIELKCNPPKQKGPR
jgi:hypothetical protein